MRQLGSLEAPLAMAEDGGDKNVGCGRDYGCERVEGCLLPCWLWTMEDGPMEDGLMEDGPMDDGSGVSVSSRSQKICEHFVSVRCRCSQNAHKMLTKCSQNFVSVTENRQKQFAKFSLKNPGLSCELVLLFATKCDQ
jgi:hypothetical protein